MSHLDELKEGIIQALDNLENSVKNINKKEYSQRPKIIRRCEGQLVDIKTKIESFDLEILYEDKARAVPYKEALKQIQSRHKKIEDLIEFKKKERETEGTLLGEIMKKKENDESGGNNY